MEAVEQALNREQSKIPPPEPPQIRSVTDIQRILGEYSPSNRINQQHEKIEISMDIEAIDERGQTRLVRVQSSRDAKNRRDTLVELFVVIKKRETDKNIIEAKPKMSIPVNGRDMVSPFAIRLDGSMPVDTFVKYYFGGYREGSLICWDLHDGKYLYDIIEHRLWKE